MGAALHNRMSGSLKARDATANSILKTLAYFDIFQYPLTQQEIRQFLDRPVSLQAMEISLQELLAEELIFLYQDFYSLHDNPLLACRRVNGNRQAERLLSKALRIGRFLYQFPFVRGVGISGSLSKNFADEKADIDFFIITRANRLWIARTLMHLFKKLTFLTRSQHFYCMNYYIDEEALLLPEKNIFTAIELKTLLPVSGEPAFRQFFTMNAWTQHWLPVCEYREQARKDKKASPFKRFVEWLGNGWVGNKLDNYLMQVTGRRWKRKSEQGKRNEKGQRMGLITAKHFARSNPGGLKEKVLNLYAHKLDELNCRK